MKRFFAKSVRINFLLFLSVLFLFSGCASYYYRQGNEMYNSLAYNMAIEQYQKALSKKEMLGAREKLAACYRLTNQYAKAEEQYAKIVADSASVPEDKLYYSQILMRTGKYDDAKKWLDLYLKQMPQDTAAMVLRESCDMVHALTTDTSMFIIEPAKFNASGSTFAPAKYGDGIMMAAENPGRKNKTYAWTGRAFLDVMTTKQDAGGNWETPVALKGDVNGDLHDGPAVMAPGDSVMYFTRNSYIKRKVSRDKETDVVNLKIFKASKRDTVWTNIKSLAFNSDNYSCGHPTLTSDGKTMYFTSDMPGGVGGTDIWYVTLDSAGCWCSPVNAGKTINTKQNEMFPSLMHDTILYFASEGHHTLGGLDVFKSIYSGGQWSQPYNMKTPVNSSADDFGVMIKDTSILYGYVSSNRASKDAGIDQIYFFSRVLVLNLVGIVVDSVTREPIEGAQVELTDKKTGLVIGSMATGADGNFRFVLQPESDYSVRATKDQYFADMKNITTVGKEKSEEIVARLRLLKKKKIFVLRNVLYDLDKSFIRPDAAIELDKLVKIMKDNPEVTIELSSHCDIRGKYDYNMKLSQRRAESAVAYIISKGVDAKRMVAKGYGWTKPYVVQKQEASKLAPEGTELTPKYIKKVKKKSDQEILHQLNRRTEFKITNEDVK